MKPAGYFFLLGFALALATAGRFTAPFAGAAFFAAAAGFFGFAAAFGVAGLLAAEAFGAGGPTGAGLIGTIVGGFSTAFTAGRGLR